MHQEFSDLVQAGTFAPALAMQSVANIHVGIHLKVDEQGWVVRAKSRFVACGFK